MLWEVRYKESGELVLDVACGFVEIKIILRTLEFAKKAPMEAFLVRNEQNLLDMPKSFNILNDKSWEQSFEEAQLIRV